MYVCVCVCVSVCMWVCVYKRKLIYGVLERYSDEIGRQANRLKDLKIDN